MGPLFRTKRLYNPTPAPPSQGGGGGAFSATNYDATSGNYPGGAIAQWAWYYITVASPADGNGDVKFPVGSFAIALIANPGQIDANWKILKG